MPAVCSIESRSRTITRDQSGAWDFRWSSLCTRGAQTWASVPCSRPRPMPTMVATLVAAGTGQRPNRDRAWQVLAHTRILGEHTAKCQELSCSAFARLTWARGCKCFPSLTSSLPVGFHDRPDPPPSRRRSRFYQVWCEDVISDRRSVRRTPT